MMQFNAPLPDSEVNKARANIESMLDEGMSFTPSSQVEPVAIDASNLFEFAGMDTNRTHVSFNFSNTGSDRGSNADSASAAAAT